MRNDSRAQNRSRALLHTGREHGGRGFFPRCALLLLAACGGPSLERPANKAPRAYPGTCTLIGIEEAPALVDQERDTIALVARYRDADSTTALPDVALPPFEGQAGRPQR